jgi:hypothetical protein
VGRPVVGQHIMHVQSGQRRTSSRDRPKQGGDVVMSAHSVKEARLARRPAELERARGVLAAE